MTAPKVSTSGSAVSSAELAERVIYRRAVEAAIWGMPAVNYERMLQAPIPTSTALMVEG